jgi:hypothetical protein
MRHRLALLRAGLATGIALGAQLSGTRSVHAAPLRAKPTSTLARAADKGLAAAAHKPSAVELAAGACRLGRWAAAVDLMRVVARQERSAADWLCLARAEFHTGQWVAALDSYDELAESEPPAAKKQTPLEERTTRKERAAKDRLVQDKLVQDRLLQDRLLQDTEARQLGAAEGQELEERLAWIKIAPSAPLPASVKLSLDGEPIARSRIGVAFPVQPGRHAFAVEVRGVVRELDHWRVAEGEQRKVNLSLPAEPPAAQQAVGSPRGRQRQLTPAPRQYRRELESTELSRWARGSLYAGGIGAGAGLLLLGASNAGGEFHEGVFRAGIGSLVLGGMALFTGGGLYLAEAFLDSSPNENPPEPSRPPALQPWISSNGAGVSGSF